jgi:hypothetical protein
VTGSRRGPGPEGADGELEPPSTARPPFDPVQFARESDARMRVVTEAPPSNLPTVRPPEGSATILRSLNEMRAQAGSMPELEEIATTGGARAALGANEVPYLVMALEDLSWFDLGPDAARLLASIDGVCSLETACAMAGLTAEEGATLLLTLAEQGMIGFR